MRGSMRAAYEQLAAGTSVKEGRRVGRPVPWYGAILLAGVKSQLRAEVKLRVEMELRVEKRQLVAQLESFGVARVDSTLPELLNNHASSDEEQRCAMH